MSRSKNIILTGELHCGKSTLVRDVLELCPSTFKGIFSEPIIQNNSIIGYGLRMVAKSGIFVFAHPSFETSKIFDKYSLDVAPFKVAAQYIKDSISSASPLFVLDEIGIIEKPVLEYESAVFKLLDSSVPSFIVIQKRSELLSKLKKRNDVTVFELTENNHIKVKQAVVQHLSF